jgi:hypothetical protein
MCLLGAKNATARARTILDVLMGASAVRLTCRYVVHGALLRIVFGQCVLRIAVFSFVFRRKSFRVNVSLSHLPRGRCVCQSSPGVASKTSATASQAGSSSVHGVEVGEDGSPLLEGFLIRSNCWLLIGGSKLG